MFSGLPPQILPNRAGTSKRIRNSISSEILVRFEADPCSRFAHSDCPTGPQNRNFYQPPMYQGSRKIYNRVHRGGITICQTTDGNFVGATRKTRCSSPAFFSPRYRLTYGRVCSQQADGWPFRNDVPINRLSTRRQGASIFRKTAKNDSLNRK